MIYCVWYPSGGFGHFINAVLTLYSKDFEVPHNDYSNWFTNTDDIVTMLTNHGVTV